MAIQSSIYATDGTTRTYPSTKHIATKQHCSVWKLRVSDSVWEISNVSEYSLVNNSVIFVDAVLTSLYSQVEIRVADTSDELLDSPTDIAIVSSNIADIGIVADGITGVNTVATNIASVITTSASIANVNTVSGSIANVNIVGGSIVNVNAVALNAANINVVASDLLEPVSEIDTVATSITNVNTVGSAIANVNTVATNITNVNSVANTIVPNIAEILLADDNAIIATEQAAIATAMATVCTSTYDQFDDRYLGPKATPPLVDNDGNALVYGTLYFDTTQNFMKVWSNAGWINAGSSVNGTTERYTYHATAGQTVFAATYEAGYIDVFLNGSKLENGVDFTAVTATDITLTSPAALNDVVDIICYAVFELSTAPTKDVVAYTVSTVADLASVPSSYTTAIVKDLDRGGTFIWSSTGTANGGTVFAGATGFWNRQYSGAVGVDWFGAKATDSTTAIQTALNNSTNVICSDNYTYNISSTLVVPDYCTFSGSGEKTVINVTNDNVAISIKAYADVSKFKVTKSGTHTKNLVEVGSLTYHGSRSTVHDMYITGAGNDGLQIRDGNLGTISNIVSVFNGRDGINFTKETQNNNAWVISGMNDLRSNGRDGFNLEMGASSGDAYAPKSISADMLTTQENGRYGVYIGTRSNSIVVYSEGNTAIGNTVNQIFLDTHAAGNYIISTEAAITDNSASPAGNFCSHSYGGAGYDRLPISKVKFAGGTGKGLRISNNDATSGYLDLEKTSSGNYKFISGGYGAEQTTTFTHLQYPTYGHNVLFNGYIQPNSLRINDDVATNKIEFLNNTTTGKLSFYKSAANTYYFQTSAASGGQNVYFDSASGLTNWRFNGLVVPAIDNAHSLGVTSLRWSVVYAATGTINTSDERLKTFFDIEEAEINCAKALKSMMSKFKFNDSVDVKGLDARIHYGVGAQSVIAKVSEFGLDPMKYAFICYDKWDETVETYDTEGNILQQHIPAGDRYGIRYDELLCFIISAM